MFQNFSPNELAVLRERAMQIAADKQDGRAENTRNVLLCQIGAEWYALPLQDLSAIYREVTITPLPGAPPLLSGVANIRGRILPVVNIAQLLTQQSTQTSKSHELVVVSHHDNQLALQVQQVGDVMVYTDHDLEAIPDEIHSDGLVASLHGGTILLDLAVLLNSPDMIIDTQIKVME
jgi:chemotaxis signal transduction protein